MLQCIYLYIVNIKQKWKENLFRYVGPKTNSHTETHTEKTYTGEEDKHLSYHYFIAFVVFCGLARSWPRRERGEQERCPSLASYDFFFLLSSYVDPQSGKNPGVNDQLSYWRARHGSVVLLGAWTKHVTWQGIGWTLSVPFNNFKLQDVLLLFFRLPSLTYQYVCWQCFCTVCIQNHCLLRSACLCLLRRRLDNIVKLLGFHLSVGVYSKIVSNAHSNAKVGTWHLWSVLSIFLVLCRMWEKFENRQNKYKDCIFI